MENKPASSGLVKLSAVVVCLNEEEKIADCLDSLSFVGDIVVVDSGSTDRTLEICRAKGARVFHNEWKGYIEQKNFALGKVDSEWVLSLDADERISASLRDEILVELIDPSADGYLIPRLAYYVNRWIYRCGWFPDRKMRLFRRGMGRWIGENPHDRVSVGKGKVAKMDGIIYHLSFEDIAAHVRTLNDFSTIGAQERLKKGKRSGMVSVITRPLFTFVKMYFIRLGFLEGAPGFIVSALSAYHVFSKYWKIMEMMENGDGKAEG
ncbi:MAG: glycosyltransferase family 2 protein [Nitrospinota bacterium]|nr:glycosyltransferase family 2 protein [Nitrospinota bacterium]